MSEDDPDRFYEILEHEYLRVRGHGAVVSAEDFRVMQDWRRDGVPVGLILEALDGVAERGGRDSRGRPIRSLRFLAPAVEEAYRNFLELQAPGHRDPS